MSKIDWHARAAAPALRWRQPMKWSKYYGFPVKLPVPPPIAADGFPADEQPIAARS